MVENNNPAGASSVDLSESSADTLVALAKGGIGGVPVIGSFLAEVVGSIIPRQRLDRIARFVEILDDRVKEIESEKLHAKMREEQFVDLLEDGMWQAARSLSDERRGYIASLLKNSITREELSHLEEKRLLDILGQLSDPEVIILQSMAFHPGQDHREFRERHQHVLSPPVAHLGSTADEIDRAAIYKTYRTRLASYGLIRPRFKKPKRNELPEFDPDTGMMESSGHEITRLGRLLLQYLDLPTR